MDTLIFTHIFVQHSQMLVVRKEGKAHAQYNSFRSAFELLESVGRDPQDCFDERHEDLPPLQKLEQRVTQLQTTQQQTQAHMQQRIDLLESGGRDPLNCLDEVLLQKMEQRLEKRMQQQIEQLQTSHQQQIASHQQQIEQLQTKQQTQSQQIAKLMLENELLRSTVNDVLK